MKLTKQLLGLANYASTSSLRPFLQVVNFQKTRAFATDSYILHAIDENFDFVKENETISFLAEDFKKLKTLIIKIKGLKQICDELTVTQSGDFYIFTNLENSSITIRKQDVRLPDYTQILPRNTDNLTLISVNAELLKTILNSFESGEIQIAFDSTRETAPLYIQDYKSDKNNALSVLMPLLHKELIPNTIIGIKEKELPGTFTI